MLSTCPRTRRISPSPDLYVITVGSDHITDSTSNIRSQCWLDGRIGSAEAFRLAEWISDAAVGVVARVNY
jgi:hypothetical protein